MVVLPAFPQDNNKENEEKQEKKNWFQRIFTKQPVEIHDTVYIFVNEHLNEEDEPDLIEEERTGAIPMPFDTLNTDDKFQKVILFDNGSWVYYEIPKPDIPDFISNDHWMTKQVHAYMNTPSTTRASCSNTLRRSTSTTRTRKRTCAPTTSSPRARRCRPATTSLTFTTTMTTWWDRPLSI